MKYTIAFIPISPWVLQVHVQMYVGGANIKSCQSNIGMQFIKLKAKITHNAQQNLFRQIDRE